jgi:hypothetical protein
MARKQGRHLLAFGILEETGNSNNILAGTHSEKTPFEIRVCRHYVRKFFFHENLCVIFHHQLLQGEPHASSFS